MKKTLIVTFLLIVSLSLLFTQAFAYSPDKYGQTVSVSGKPQKTPNGPKSPNAGQKVKNHAPDTGEAVEPTDASADPVETEVSGDGHGKPANHPGNGNGNQGNGNGNGKAVLDEQPTGGTGEGEKPAKTHGAINGTVSSVDGNTVVITLKDGSTVTITLDANTQLKIPTLKDTTGFEFKPGQRMAVRLTQNEDGSYSAAQAHLIPGKPEKVHRVGTVTEYIPGVSITVTDKFGNTSTFALTEGTKILNDEGEAALGVGSVVTIISPRDVTGGDLTAKGIVVHTITDEEEPDGPRLPGGTLSPISTAEPTATVEPTATAQPTATEESTETLEPTATVTTTATATSEAPAVP